METLKNFRKAAISRNLCAAYLKKWDSCQSKKQLFDLATDSNGLAYIGESIAEGWGLTSEYIKKNFGGFINGRCIAEHNGYTSSMYVGIESGDIDVMSTSIMVINCKCNLNFPKQGVKRVYAVNSEITINGGLCYLFEYGTNKVTALNDTDVRHRR